MADAPVNDWLSTHPRLLLAAKITVVICIMVRWIPLIEAVNDRFWRWLWYGRTKQRDEKELLAAMHSAWKAEFDEAAFDRFFGNELVNPPDEEEIRGDVAWLRKQEFLRFPIDEHSRGQKH